MLIEGGLKINKSFHAKLKGEHWRTMIFYHIEQGFILSIFAHFLFAEAKFKLTKKTKL
jgi:hypothetical protein